MTILLSELSFKYIYDTSNLCGNRPHKLFVRRTILNHGNYLYTVPRLDPIWETLYTICSDNFDAGMDYRDVFVDRFDSNIAFRNKLDVMRFRLLV